MSLFCQFFHFIRRSVTLMRHTKSHIWWRYPLDSTIPGVLLFFCYFFCIDCSTVPICLWFLYNICTPSSLYLPSHCFLNFHFKSWGFQAHGCPDWIFNTYVQIWNKSNAPPVIMYCGQTQRSVAQRGSGVGRWCRVVGTPAWGGTLIFRHIVCRYIDIFKTFVYTQPWVRNIAFSLREALKNG